MDKDIQEIEIVVAKKKSKKVSRKVINASQKWLQEEGVDLEDLSESQREVVFCIIKEKRGLFWLLPVSLIVLLMYTGLVIFGVKLISEMKIDFAPRCYMAEKDNGEKETKAIPKEIQESFISYGNVLVVFGLFLGGLLYFAMNAIIQPIASYFAYKRQKKTIQAFLPLVRSD